VGNYDEMDDDDARAGVSVRVETKADVYGDEHHGGGPADEKSQDARGHVGFD